LKKKLIIIVILVMVLIVCGYGGKSAVTGGKLHRYLVVHGIRSRGTYNGKKIDAFNKISSRTSTWYSFRTVDGKSFKIQPDGTVVDNSEATWLDISLDDPGSRIHTPTDPNQTRMGMVSDDKAQDNDQIPQSVNIPSSR
jgi:hypothetical protein